MIPFANAPTSVQKSILSYSIKTPTEIEQETDKNGRTLYECSFVKYGQENEIKLGSNGAVIEEESVIGATSVPQLVLDALRAKLWES